MEMQSFVFGMLTMVGIALVVLAVIGAVKIIKQGRRINDLEMTVANNHNDIYGELGRVDEAIRRDMEEIRKDGLSYTDKRVDKIKVDKQ